MMSPGFLPAASKRRDDCHGKMCGVAEDQVDVGVGDQLVVGDGAGCSAAHCIAGSRDDLHIRKGRHLLIEALLDVERVWVARIAQDLKDFALGRAMLGGQQLFGLFGGDWPISTVPATDVKSEGVEVI